MLLLSALWLAVVQALASLAVPAGPGGPVDGPSRLAGITAIRGASYADEEQFRPPLPQRLRSVDRTSDRGVPPLRSPLGVVPVASAEVSFSLASLTPPAEHQVSHAVASRGGHLPYYPTAPPLQG